MDYNGYHNYIDQHLPSENPSLYGLHPNAELKCLTVTSDNLFKTLLELQPQDSCRGERAAQSTEAYKKWPSYISNLIFYYLLCLLGQVCHWRYPWQASWGVQHGRYNDKNNKAKPLHFSLFPGVWAYELSASRNKEVPQWAGSLLEVNACRDIYEI